MIELLNSLFAALSPLWGMSLTAAYAAAVVALLRLVLKRRAPRRMLCLLWLVVFARLLIPVSLESPLSIIPDARQVRQVRELPARLTGAEPPSPGRNQGPVQDPALGLPGGLTASPASQEKLDPGAASDFPALAVPEGVTSGAPQAEPPAGFPWQALTAGVWLAGAAAMGGYGLVSYWRLRRRLYDAILTRDGAWEHPSVSSPFILGVLRPRIYLPAGLDGQPRQFILCHERAHLRRLDHVVKPVCWAVLALHWFNPLVWMAFLLMGRDIEAACDEAVIRRLGSEVKADYSDTLLALAAGRRFPAPCSLAFDEGSAKGRIQNVLRYRRPAVWIVAVSVMAAALAAVCLLTDPVSAQLPEGAPDPEASASQEADPAPSPSPAGGDPIADPWMLEVLDGEREFLLEGRESLTVDRLSAAIYDNQHSVTVSKVSVIDLDRDGASEMVVWPSIDGDDSIEEVSVPGYLILRRQGDTVYGFNPSFRAFAYLKEDGTFYWSDSAFEGGIARAAFPDGMDFALENVSWSNIGPYHENYFVDGVETDRADYIAAIYAQDHKPEAPWYVYEGGKLWPAPPDAPFRPDSLLDDPGPRDLTPEELEYFQEYFTLGDGIPNIRSMLLVSEYGDPRDIDLYRTFYHGFHYALSQEELDALDWHGGVEVFKVTAAEMNQALWAYLGLGLEETNKVGLEYFRYLPEFDAYYSLHNDFGGSRVAVRWGRILADGAVELVYDSADLQATRVAVLREAVQIYAHRLYYQVVSNLPADGRDLYASLTAAEETAPSPAPEAAPEPSAPSPAPESTPEPSVNPSAAPAVCEHGLDSAVFEFADGILVLFCEEDGVRYPVPAITAENYKGHFRGDFDNDGRLEVPFTRDDGTLLMADVADGVFRTYSFDPSYLADDFNDTVTYELLGEYQELRFTYQGYGHAADLSGQWTAMMTHGRSYYPYAYGRGATYAFDRDRIDMMIPVWLENGFSGPFCFLNWRLRYTGDGFQVISSSFGYRVP